MRYSWDINGIMGIEWEWNGTIMYYKENMIAIEWKQNGIIIAQIVVYHGILWDIKKTSFQDDVCNVINESEDILVTLW